MSKHIFCKRLKFARQAKGLSQKSLGILAGLDEFVASTRINRYEVGVHVASPTIVHQLASVLDMPISYFYEDDDVIAQCILQLYLLPSNKRKSALQALERLS